MKRLAWLSVILLVSLGCNNTGSEPGVLELTGLFAGNLQIEMTGDITENVPTDRNLVLTFSTQLNETTLDGGILLKEGEESTNVTVNLLEDNKSVSVSTIGPMLDNTIYTVVVTEHLTSAEGVNSKPVSIGFRTSANTLVINNVYFNGMDAGTLGRLQSIPLDLSVTIDFSSAVNVTTLEQALSIPGVSVQVTASNDSRTMTVESVNSLDYLKKYEFSISDELKSEAGGSFDGYEIEFFTQIDSTYKFPEINDDELLTKIQERTFRYFWDFAHPVSGMARERNTSGDIVTTGGSGFGVMGIIAGIERGFITRQQGIDRLETIVNFLESADRFHGVWPHWMDGTTGEVIPFSTNDNGGDLVETAFMIQGLLTVREYLNPGDSQESNIIHTITTLWEEVEWNWYTQGGQNVLYWHWSPNFSWEKNLPIRGWNESLIVYVLAASSPTYSISTDVYSEGWARNGAITNGNSYFGITLPLGENLGGPLFFSHYSFLGVDPRNLEDEYANYWDQNVNHTLINRAYCANNPKQYIGYSEDIWGLTASDNHEGYAAHSPTNDLGVITPTAAISSIPYTPEESMDAIRFFYYILGDKVWGEYGFYDAFNLTEEWVAESYLAIDQGPILIMIENYRSALLWELFMSTPEIDNGLNKLGFKNGF